MTGAHLCEGFDRGLRLRRDDRCRCPACCKTSESFVDISTHRLSWLASENHLFTLRNPERSQYRHGKPVDDATGCGRTRSVRL